MLKSKGTCEISKKISYQEIWQGAASASFSLQTAAVMIQASSPHQGQCIYRAIH